MESKNKNLWIGLGALGVLVGSAILYHYAVSGEDGGDESIKLTEDLKAAGFEQSTIKLVQNGQLIDPQQFLKLL